MDEIIELDDFINQMKDDDEQAILDDMMPKVETWVTSNGKDFFFSYRNEKTIPSGLYSMIFTETNGFGLSKISYKHDEYYPLPSLPHGKIIKDLKKFWDNRDRFKRYGLNPKRGVILHGTPGCGKTSLIYLLVEEMKKRNGICIYFDVPQNWIEIAKMVRKVEKDRPILTIIEDIDLIIKKYGEEPFLNFLDGLNGIDNVIYVATTNNLEQIPDRIKNRPSRFDKTYEIKKPTDEDRKIYFKRMILPEDETKYDLEKLVKDTTGFTMAHLKEVFISLYILENPYAEVVKGLKGAKINEQNKIGFGIGDEEY